MRVTTVPATFALAGGDKGFPGQMPTDDKWDQLHLPQGDMDAQTSRTDR